MFIIGLIGKTLDHSFSEKYFNQKFLSMGINNFIYKNFPLTEIAKIENLILDNENLIGFNVTIPFKEKIIPYLTKISIEASEIGAVNTVLVDRFNNKCMLSGFNTDHIGFEKTLLTFDIKLIKNTKALIFGTGGSSKAVAFTLKKMNVPYIKVSRIKSANYLTYNDLDNQIVANHKLLINCTPVGMYPEISKILNIPFQAITKEHVMIDLIYNPEKTKFLIEGDKYGANTINGGIMLQEQAEAAWNLFETKILN